MYLIIAPFIGLTIFFRNNNIVEMFIEYYDSIILVMFFIDLYINIYKNFQYFEMV